MNNNFRVQFIHLRTQQNTIDRTRNFTLRSKFNIPIITVPCKIQDIRRIDAALDLQFPQKEIRFIIGAGDPTLAILTRLFTRRHTIFDMGWLQSDSNFSRGVAWRCAHISIKNILLDLLSIFLVDNLIVESPEQLKRKIFKWKLQKNNAQWLYTGFFAQESILSEEKELAMSSLREGYPRALFRGKYNAESGIKMLASASWLEEFKLDLMVLAQNLPKNIEFHPRVKVVNNFLPWDEISQLFLSTELVLGQMSNHRRLRYTIPHKFYESCFFGKPYFTMRTAPLLSILGSEYPFSKEFSDSSELANYLTSTLADKKKLLKMEQQIKAVYENQLNPESIIDKFDLILGC